MEEDEPIILESRNVKFKSILFDAILTNKRIHLTDSKKNVIPSQDIVLTSIRNVEREENAIRDHFLILSLITDAGEKHQMVLTFARQSGVERKRECNEWAKKIKSLIPPPAPFISRSEVPEEKKELLVKREVPTPAQGTVSSTHPAKKKIEITRPTRTGIEKSPGAPEPIETTALTSGSFCSRCGNRVPLKSTFCNSCERPIEPPSGLGQEPQPVVIKVKESIQPPAPQQAITKVKVIPRPLTPQPVVAKVQETVLPLTPQPVVAKVQETVLTPQPVVAKVQETVLTPHPVVAKVQETGLPPAGSSRESESSRIPQVIHPIEPLIKDSLPTTRQHTDPVLQDLPSSTVTHPVSSPQVLWPSSPPPHMIPAHEGKKPYITIGILIMAILPFLVGLVIVANIISGPTAGPANTTPQIPIATSILNQSTTQATIPSSGVWVRVSYAGTYIGLIGTPDNQTEVNDTGDHIYPIPTGEKAVAAVLQKNDSSENQIILEVYKNGVMLKRETSIAPKAILEIQLDVKT